MDRVLKTIVQVGMVGWIAYAMGIIDGSEVLIAMTATAVASLIFNLFVYYKVELPAYRERQAAGPGEYVNPYDAETKQLEKAMQVGAYNPMNQPERKPSKYGLLDTCE